MRLSRSGNQRYCGHTKVFDAPPRISWDKQSKEIKLSVRRVRGVSGDRSFYNYSISLTVAELQAMVGSLASEESR